MISAKLLKIVRFVSAEPFSIYSRGLKIVRISIKTDRGRERKKEEEGNGWGKK